MGTYRIDYSERSGTCGPLTETIFVANDQPAAPSPGCTGDVTVSADGCTVTINTVCNADQVAKGAKVRNVGDVHWTVDGSSGSGTIELQGINPNGTIDCQSTYDVTYTRQ